MGLSEAILLVEDDPDLGRIVRESLEHEGHTTLVAHSAAASTRRTGSSR